MSLRIRSFAPTHQVCSTDKRSELTEQATAEPASQSDTPSTSAGLHIPPPRFPRLPSLEQASRSIQNEREAQGSKLSDKTALQLWEETEAQLQASSSIGTAVAETSGPAALESSDTSHLDSRLQNLHTRDASQQSTATGASTVHGDPGGDETPGYQVTTSSSGPHTDAFPAHR